MATTTKRKPKKRREPPLPSTEELLAEFDEPPTLFDRVADELMRAEALLNCAKYSLQYKDDPGTLIDGEDPIESVDDEIKLLHECGKVLTIVYDLVDEDQSARNREKRAQERKRTKAKHK